MSDFIPLSVPCIKGNEWKYIKECLDNEWVSSVGSYVDLFEKKIAEYTGARYAIACVNGTSALHIALLISGVLPGDEVIVPTLTFIAPINTVCYCGAYPVFMDADKFYNIDAEKACDFILKETNLKKIKTRGREQFYSFNKKTGRRIPAIIPVHIFGNAVRLDELYDLCKERNIKIIEDATESFGTRYIKGKLKGKHTGTIGNFGCLSFNGNKIITTGGGGMILTNKKSFADKARYLTTQAKDDGEKFIHNEIGYNYRLSNIQAALGVAQLEQLPDYLKTKKNNYSFYKKAIEGIKGLYLADVPYYADNNHWMYALQINKKEYGRNKEQLLKHLKKSNIQTKPVWYLNHLQKEFKGCEIYNIENAGNLHEITLNIPCSSNLSNKDLIKVIEYLYEN